MEHDVFISYSSKNSDTANAICHVLEENKIKCWIAPRNIQPGSDYADCIDNAISTCKIFILVFSAPSQESKWVKGELNVAFDSNKIIIPFKVENVSLYGAMRVILNDKHWLDAYPNPEIKFRELVVLSKRLLKEDLSDNIFSPTYDAKRAISSPLENNVTFWSLIKRMFVTKKVRIMSNKPCLIRVNGGKKENTPKDTLKMINVKDDIVDIEVVSEEYKNVKLYYTINLNELGYQIFRIDLAKEEKKYLMERANKGGTYELNALGITFLDEGNYAEAQQCFLKASNKGEAAASYNLGMMYHYGKGVEKDYSTSMEFYNMAIKDNYPLALNNLGSMYYNGEGVQKDLKKAYELFYKAAERDLENAQFTVASMLFYGQGVDVDKEKAKFWFQRAAQQGSSEAQKYLNSWNN